MFDGAVGALVDLFPQISKKFVEERFGMLMRKENSNVEKIRNFLMNQIIKMNGNYPKENRKGHYICSVCGEFVFFVFIGIDDM
jgi:hypothetical protein